MTAPPVGKRGFVSLSAVLAVLLVVMEAGAAHAEGAASNFRFSSFRKKAPPADSATEGSPSGGEIGTEAAPAGESAPVPGAAQADDKDFPEAQAQRDKARADAALERQMKNAELAKEKERGTPFYQKWEFWAIAGGVVVGTALLVVGGVAIAHSAGGGDVRSCPMNAAAGCFGEGR